MSNGKEEMENKEMNIRSPMSNQLECHSNRTEKIMKLKLLRGKKRCKNIVLKKMTLHMEKVYQAMMRESPRLKKIFVKLANPRHREKLLEERKSSTIQRIRNKNDLCFAKATLEVRKQ